MNCEFNDIKDFLWLLWLNYWWVLVMELEVRYNYSGVKNFWCKSWKKNTRPLRFLQTDFWFQTGFLQIEANKATMSRYCVFYMETKVFSLHSPRFIISKKGIDKNNLCRLINLSEVPKDCNQCTWLSQLSCLVSLRLSCSKYIVYLSAWVCKVPELSCCLSLIAL